MGHVAASKRAGDAVVTLDDHRPEPRFRSLGEQVRPVTSFDAAVLEQIPRQHAEVEGVDILNAHDICWTAQDGTVRGGIAEIRIPATSPFLVETKSLKLYLQSLMLERWDDEAHVADQMAIDIRKACGAFARTTLSDLGAADQITIKRRALQGGDEIVLGPGEGTRLVASDSTAEHYRGQCHTFHTRCPVTGQTDPATINIEVFAPKVGLGTHRMVTETLTDMLNVQEFNEACATSIYLQLSERLRPQTLCVECHYQRRGGIEINASRWSHELYAPMSFPNYRSWRQ